MEEIQEFFQFFSSQKLAEIEIDSYKLKNPQSKLIIKEFEVR